MEIKLKEWTLIDGNCPTWPGASAVYSKAYRWMKKHGPNDNLIKSLNKGDEEAIKGFFFSYTFRRSLDKDPKWNARLDY
jgi:hypothetical protein